MIFIKNVWSNKIKTMRRAQNIRVIRMVEMINLYRIAVIESDARDHFEHLGLGGILLK
jgi:hypothetical protein